MTAEAASFDRVSTPLKLEKVAVVIDDDVSTFEFAIPVEVFGVDRSPQGMPKFEFAVCSPRAAARRRASASSGGAS